MSYPTGSTVKISRTQYDGDEKRETKTCLVVDIGDTVATLCGGETFHDGDIEADYEDGTYIDRRSVTCPDCKFQMNKWAELLKIK